MLDRIVQVNPVVTLTTYIHKAPLFELRGRADKFCLHLNRKWTGKDILMKLKKKYAYDNYFQNYIIIFLQNHHALQYTSANAALVFEIRP